MTGVLGTVAAEQAAGAAETFAPDPEAYRARFPDSKELDDVVRSDWLFRMPSLHLAEAQRQAGGTAYLYELTWPAPGLGGVLGACHGLDVPLVLGNLTAGRTAMLLGDVTEAMTVVSEQMQGAWTQFASTGDPGWAAFDDSAMTRVFDVDPCVAPYPEQASRDMWPDPPRPLALLSGGSLVRCRKWRTAHVKHACSTWAYSGGLTLRGQARRASSWRRECWWMRAHAAQSLSARML